MTGNTFFIGAPKCGSTSLWNLFRRHPDIFVSETKETMHFIKDYWKGDSEYFKTLEGKGDKPLFDFQPNHCLYPYAAERIEMTVGKFRAVMMVREPISRAYSEMCHFSKMRPGRLSPDFDSIIRWNMLNFDDNLFSDEGEYMMQADPRGGCYRPVFLENSCYANHYGRFSNYNMIVLNYHSFIDHKIDSANHLCDLLGLEHFARGTQFPWLNSKTDNKYFSDETVRDLRHFFKPHNERLSELAGADFEDLWYGE